MEDVYREQPVKAFRWGRDDADGGLGRLKNLKNQDVGCMTSSRYAKMRLERIEKMGEEMMEILPQVTKMEVKMGFAEDNLETR